MFLKMCTILLINVTPVLRGWFNTKHQKMKHYLIEQWNENTQRGSFGHQNCVFNVMLFKSRKEAQEQLVDWVFDYQPAYDPAEIEQDESFDFGDGSYRIINKSQLLKCNLEPDITHQKRGAMTKADLKGYNYL